VSPARRSYATAAVIAVAAGGIAYQAGESGLGLAPGLGVWIGLLGLGGLIALLLSAPTGANSGVVSSDDAGWTEFRRELRRARRGSRPLTLLRIAGDELPKAGPGGSLDLPTRSRRLGLQLRLVDRTWVDEGSIYVLLPDSPRSAADALVERIHNETPDQLPERIRVATFPEDGLTSGAIIAAVFDGAIDEVPIPIRPTTADSADAFAMEEERSVGEAVK
jgi:hypothetical protein